MRKLTVSCETPLTAGIAAELAQSAYGTIVLPFAAAGDAALRENIARLREGQIVRNVLFALRERIDCGVLAAAIDHYAVDGVDLQAEEVAELVDFIAGMGKLVIASPSSNLPFWIDVLRATGRRMRWWNLQLGNRCEYAAWIAAIAESGVMSAEEAREFVVPGYRASCSTPEFVAYDIEGIRLLAGGIGGVFLRRYEDVRPRAADWARAVALAAV